MAPTRDHGKICYIEIPAVDVEASAAFYREAFGWEIRTRDDGQELEWHRRIDAREIHSGPLPVTSIERHVLCGLHDHVAKLYRVHVPLSPI